MIKLLKKYWTHIINILLFVFLILIFSFFNLLEGEDINFVTGLILTLELILVIMIWVEIIYYIIYVDRAKDIPNKGLKALFMYFLPYWYIPCFKLKYVDKDKNYKKKNIIYLIVSISLFVLSMFVYVLNFI